MLHQWRLSASLSSPHLYFYIFLPEEWHRMKCENYKARGTLAPPPLKKNLVSPDLYLIPSLAHSALQYCSSVPSINSCIYKTEQFSSLCLQQNNLTATVNLVQSWGHAIDLWHYSGLKSTTKSSLYRGDYRTEFIAFSIFWEVFYDLCLLAIFLRFSNALVILPWPPYF